MKSEMTRSEEMDWRRKLLQSLNSMSEEDQRKEQLKSMDFLDRCPKGPARHWAAHRFINITVFRSFGKLDDPCRHRRPNA
jgi:hypothetical protein